MSKFIDITGQKFGRLTVIKKDYFDKKSHSTYWVCQCDCGNIKSINGSKIKNGNTTSCGCYAKEMVLKANIKKIPKENFLDVHNPELLKEWDYNKNKIKPSEISYGSNKKVWWLCNKGHSYKMLVNSKTIDNHKCPYCTNQKVLFGYNDVYTTHPELRKYFVNIEDAKSITYGSGKKVLLKCPNCGTEKYLELSNLYNQGFGCPSCSDGISLGEKIIFNLLKSLNIEFDKEYIFDWAKDKKYDFYIPSKNCIIEVMGKQHIKQTRNIKGCRTLQEEQENDKLKEQLALNNEVKYYIKLDYYKTDFEYFKNIIINSSLFKILNVENESVNWKNIGIESSKSVLLESCRLFNEGYLIKDIIDIFKLNRTTISNYLKNGTKIGICNYIPIKNEKIYVKELNKIFNSKHKCCQELHIWVKTLDKFLDTGMKYKDYTFETYKED